MNAVAMETKDEFNMQILEDMGVVKVQPMKRKRTEVPLWRKRLLTLEEAAEYTGIGMQKLRDISNDDRCDFVLWNGSKRMFKREKLDAYLDQAYSI